MKPVALAALVLCAAAACAQEYPAKPIRVLAPSSGGTADFVARAIAQGLTASMGQQVVVDNRGNDLTPVMLLLRAPADGHTLMLFGTQVWLTPYMRDNVGYDTLKDLATISLTNRAPTVLVVPTAFPAKSVKELIAMAKAKPGALNYATTAAGNATHIAGEMFKSMAGVDIVRVNYNATTTAVTDLISNRVQIMFGIAGTVTPQIKSGRLMALAVTSARPSALFRGVPTLAASGVPGYESEQMNGIFGPAKMPAARITRINQEVVRYLNLPEAKERFLNIGVEPVGSSSQEFAAVIKAESARIGKLIKDVGIRDE